MNNTDDDGPLLLQHLVVPGQVIAVSSKETTEDSSSFLRGHGTYLETTDAEHRLIAAVTGTVVRVNKLVSVQSNSSASYQAQTGDLVVGRIAAVGAGRWNVILSGHERTAALPLAGVHLPGGIQRVRTAQDAREMRHYLQEGDLVSAEVHKVQATVFLHTRSLRYGKLENGCLVTVPPALVPRRKNHYTTVAVGEREFEVLFGCNGMIWMQRKLSDNSTGAASQGQDNTELLQEQRRAEHAATPYSMEERVPLARLRNSVECLRMTQSMITVESLLDVCTRSLSIKVSEMLAPEQVLRLTANQRPG